MTESETEFVDERDAAPGVGDPEAPEADAAEQSVPVESEEERTAPTTRVGTEADEYDAVEQSRIVGYEDEYR
ncbi:hypothetical protein [Actinocatenispora rupis]|uniref:Uncharacterized protein n=1 Tax=Actinocatenispora rupis TaxID=519421 RepID=A0A8J3J8Q5_9ACTN|nr:hypothetical protein [Actinocatenispora rupis]GID13997.1 hypothetical protein Aru02nite_48860 [Actinocatenispora rupis]